MNSKTVICGFLLLLIPAAPLYAELPNKEPSILEESVPVWGYVINPDGNRVAWAVVLIVETGQKVIADNRGVFLFHAVLRAKVTFRASSEDYETVITGPLDLTKPLNKPVEIRFEKVRTFESTITVTATLYERLLRDVPVRVEVITSRQIEERAAVTLADVLEATTGLRVENNCQNCGFNSLRINGLEGSYTHILLNDLNAFSSLASVYGLEHIPAIIIDRIEVVKGGASSLYGAGAVGGVVNVITKQPTHNAASFEANYSSMGGEACGNIRGYGSWVGSGGRSSLFAYGDFNKSDPYDRNGDAFTDVPRKSLKCGGIFYFRRVLNDQAELHAGLELTHEDRRGGDDLNLEPHETELTEWIESTRYNYSAQWNHFLSGNTYYRLQFSHVSTDRNTYYGGGMNPYAYGYTTNPHTNFALTCSHTISRHVFLGGFQYERDSIDDRHPGYGYRLEQTYDCHSLFVQDDLEVTDYIRLLIGGRVDKHSALSDPVFSPRISALMRAGHKISIRSNLSFGFKAPSVFDEDLHILISGGEPTFHVNDPDLREERAVSFSLSGEYADYDAGKISTRFEANFFYTRLMDTFVTDERVGEIEGASLFVRVNGGSSKVYGLELNADLKFSSVFNIETGFTVQRARLDEAEPDFGAFDFFRTPETYGFLLATFSNERLSVSGRLDYTGKMSAPHYAGWIDEDRLEQTPIFTVLSFRTEVPLIRNQFKVSLVGNIYNLTDEFQEDLDRGPGRDAGYIYGPRRPRTFSIGLKIGL